MLRNQNNQDKLIVDSNSLIKPLLEGLYLVNHIRTNAVKTKANLLVRAFLMV